MKLPRRNFLHLAASATALPAVSRIAWAQAYPTRSSQETAVLRVSIQPRGQNLSGGQWRRAIRYSTIPVPLLGRAPSI
jgi:hypothetical protein